MIQINFFMSLNINSVFTDLSSYGTKGHECLEFRLHKGEAYPKTKKAHWYQRIAYSIKSIFTNHKADRQLSHCLLNFFEEHQTETSNNLETLKKFKKICTLDPLSKQRYINLKQSQLKAVKQELKTAKHEKAKLKKRLKGKKLIKTEIKDLKKELSAIKLEKTKLEKRLNIKRLDINGLKTEIEKKKSLLSMLNVKCDEKIQQLKPLDNKVKDLTAVLTTQKQIYNKLQEQLKSANQDISSADAIKERLTTENQEKELILTKLNQEISENIHQLKAQESMIKELNKELAQLKEARQEEAARLMDILNRASGIFQNYFQLKSQTTQKKSDDPEIPLGKREVDSDVPEKTQEFNAPTLNAFFTELALLKLEEEGHETKIRCIVRTGQYPNLILKIRSHEDSTHYDYIRTHADLVKDFTYFSRLLGNEFREENTFSIKEKEVFIKEKWLIPLVADFETVALFLDNLTHCRSHHNECPIKMFNLLLFATNYSLDTLAKELIEFLQQKCFASDIGGILKVCVNPDFLSISYFNLCLDYLATRFFHLTQAQFNSIDNHEILCHILERSDLFVLEFNILMKTIQRCKELTKPINHTLEDAVALFEEHFSKYIRFDLISKEQLKKLSQDDLGFLKKVPLNLYTTTQDGLLRCHQNFNPISYTANGFLNISCYGAKDFIWTDPYSKVQQPISVSFQYSENTLHLSFDCDKSEMTITMVWFVSLDKSFTFKSSFSFKDGIHYHTFTSPMTDVEWESFSNGYCYQLQLLCLRKK